MKILVLANKLPYPPRDGGSIATLNMITGLADSGHQITCLALNTLKHHYPVDQIPASLAGRIRFIGIPCDSSLKPLAMLSNILFSTEPYIAERFRNPEFEKRLTELLDREQFDIIQLEGPYPGHYLGVIREKSSATVSFRAHNVEHLIWRRKASHEWHPFKRWYISDMASRLERFEMKVLTDSDLLVAISPVDESYFRKRGSDGPSITIPAGLSLGSYPLTELPADPTLFFIGALDWLPNQEGLRWFLDHVFDGLCREVPGVRLHIAGRSAPASFARYLRRSRVTFHGEVEDARSFMQSYRVMAAPLLTGSGIRIKILEAMALGRPVVTTWLGMEGIPAEHGRDAMVTDDPVTFGDHLVRLLRSNEEALRLVAGGRAVIQENFDTFGLASRLTRFFEDQA
jgi:glycosyltransferase involved in cell wall biosynthesis